MNQNSKNHDPRRSQERLWEAMEVCRAGRDDPADPALGPLAEKLAAGGELAKRHGRLAKIDRALGQAIADVPLPEGLQERILVRLAEASADVDPPLVPRGAASMATRPRFARRRLLSGAVALVVSAAAATALFLLPPRGYTGEQILNLAVAEFDAAASRQGQPLPETWPERLLAHPPSNAVLRLANAQWRAAAGFSDSAAVAYDLPVWLGSRATLYVIRCKSPIEELGNAPPPEPQRTTGGRAAAAWQVDGLLYVLVVEGNARAYRGLLDPGRPLA